MPREKSITPYREFDTYGDVIDAWVVEKRAQNDAIEREPKFYASDFGTCHRKMVMKRAGIPGRPMSVDSMRNLEERGLLHDQRLQQLAMKGALIAADTGTEWIREKAPTRLSAGMPEGFGCRADGIGHVHCHCGNQPFPLKVHWGKMARLYRIDDPDARKKGEQARDQLARHRLEVVEAKTAHPNLVNYSDSLPRPHNVMQVRAAGWAIRRLYRLETYPKLLYFPVGSGAGVLEYNCGGGPEDDYEDIEREITTLQQEWAEYLEDGTLPPCKDFALKSRKEKSNRVLFRVMDWECNELYCPFCGCGCEPPQTVNQTGDRLGYEEPDGSILFVKKWLDKVPGYSIVGSANVIDKPRSGDE